MVAIFNNRLPFNEVVSSLQRSVKPKSTKYTPKKSTYIVPSTTRNEVAAKSQKNLPQPTQSQTNNKKNNKNT